MVDNYEQLANAFAGLADTLVAEYDVIELGQQLIDSSMALLPIASPPEAWDISKCFTRIRKLNGR
jgi:hypothetical protein